MTMRDPSGVAADQADATPARLEPVWDPFVRLFHWSLVVAVTVAGVTGFLLGPTWVLVHVWAATFAFALAVARLVWGFLGPAHARFADFVLGPRAVLRHAAELVGGTARRHLGHNPLGGANVVAVLAMIVLLTITGVLVLGGSLKSGPAAFATSFAAGETLRGVHQLLAVVLLGLIALHLAGIVFESRRTDENLARAMIDGAKARRPGDVPVRRVRPRPVLAATLVLALLGGGGLAAARLAQLPGLGVPTAPPDPAYAEECSACHLAYPPSLLPRASWAALMAGLDDHFGENAALDPKTTAEIAAWLEANAAETADTKAANRFRTVDPAHPFEITATPFWIRTHRHLPKALFTSPAVGSAAQCAACHEDAATGRFDPAAISIPEED